jgi:hypothetical protein
MEGLSRKVVEDAVDLTLPKREILQPKILDKALRVTEQVLEKPVKLCLGTNGECVTFHVDSNNELQVQHSGEYWPILRGVASAAVYCFGINSKQRMAQAREAGRVPYAGDFPQGRPSSSVGVVVFSFGDKLKLVAFFYHIHLLFRGTQYQYEFSGNAVNAEDIRQKEREANLKPKWRNAVDRAKQRAETRAHNVHIEADAYDYNLVKRVEEMGFYD